MGETHDTAPKGKGTAAPSDPLVISDDCFRNVGTAGRGGNARIRYIRRAEAHRRLAIDFRTSHGVAEGEPIPGYLKYPPRLYCGCTRRAGDAEIRRLDDGGTYYSNTQSCGSVWTCPVCAAKIRTRRAKEVSEAVERAEARGWGGYLVTCTLRHANGDGLRDLLDGLRDAWHDVTGGRSWQAVKADHGITGYIKSVEVTVGKNGWHPHAHTLVLVDHAATEAEAEELRGIVSDRWVRSLARRGYRLPSDEHGVRVDPIGGGMDAAGDYIAKLSGEPDSSGIASEVTLADVKAGRAGNLAPFQLLDLDDACGAWREYCEAVRGIRSILFSRGLRDLLGMGEELTDEELASEDEGGEVVARVAFDAYIKARRERPGVLADVLAAVASKDYDAAAAMLGVSWSGGGEKPVLFGRCMREAST